MITKTKSKPSRKTLKNKCDDMWKKIIYQKTYCEVCGKPPPTKEDGSKGNHNPHHVIGRDNHAVRWDIRNGCLLCSGCHTMNNGSAHKDPQDFMIWFESHRPDDYKYLLKQKNEIWDKDYDKVLEYLEEVKNEKNN